MSDGGLEFWYGYVSGLALGIGFMILVTLWVSA